MIWVAAFLCHRKSTRFIPVWHIGGGNGVKCASLVSHLHIGLWNAARDSYRQLGLWFGVRSLVPQIIRLAGLLHSKPHTGVWRSIFCNFHVLIHDSGETTTFLAQCHHARCKWLITRILQYCAILKFNSDSRRNNKLVLCNKAYIVYRCAIACYKLTPKKRLHVIFDFSFLWEIRATCV